MRVFSAVVAIALLVLPFDRIARRLIRQDPTPITAAVRSEARAINRSIMGMQLRMIGAYFKPGFHPWKLHDEEHLRRWYTSPEVAQSG